MENYNGIWYQVCYSLPPLGPSSHFHSWKCTRRLLLSLSTEDRGLVAVGFEFLSEHGLFPSLFDPESGPLGGIAFSVTV